MAGLTLNLKTEYFHAIKRGEKLEEYRLCNDYWGKRLVGRNYDSVTLCLGYPKRNDDERRITRKWGGYEIKEITHPHFGDKPVKVFAIRVAKEVNDGAENNYHNRR